MNTNLACTQSGEGFPVLFLPGFCESQEIWTDFTAPLADSFKVITADLPGFGRSTGNLKYHSVDEMAEEVYTLLNGLDIAQTVVVAHSLGGYVALALAEKYPEKIAGLCLFHSSAYADPEEKKEHRGKTVEFIERNGVVPFIENFTPPLFYEERHQELRETMRKVLGILEKTPRESAMAVTKTMRDRPDRTHVLKQAAYPVLFIAGKNDEAISFEIAQEQFYLPKHSIVQVLADTGHMGMFERPEETRQMVEKFAAICAGLRKKTP